MPDIHRITRSRRRNCKTGSVYWLARTDVHEEQKHFRRVLQEPGKLLVCWGLFFLKTEEKRGSGITVRFEEDEIVPRRKQSGRNSKHDRTIGSECYTLAFNFLFGGNCNQARLVWRCTRIGI